MPNDLDPQAAQAALGVQDGVARIEQGTPLTRLHYFDGKFLRADALTLEQDYHRNLVRLSNLAGGWGVVHGLGIALDGAQLALTPGLAITPAGNTVLLNQGFSASLAELIAAARPAPAVGSGAFGNCDCEDEPGDPSSPGTGLYEITVGPLQGLCGNEEVYGKLCEDACVTDTQRPYWREGLVLRLRPITLALPDSASQPLAAQHLRNRAASAYFKAEPWLTASLLSGAGLAGPVWCNPAALYGRDEVPIGLLAREGDSVRFLDAWSARRERMDGQARGYWQGRMRMRPWNVFLAQILQFQCQLSGVFKPGTGDFDPIDDDCRQLRQLLDETRRQIEQARKNYAAGSKKILEMLGEESAKIDSALKLLKQSDKQLGTLASQLGDSQDGPLALPKNRMLLGAGFVELPPAGYLPVQPGKQPVNEQLERMFGEGVSLTFCAARPDYIPHEVEAAQHMDRISLTRGLDNPAQKEEVEIFVPDGEIADAQGVADGVYWFADIDLKFLAQAEVKDTQKLELGAKEEKRANSFLKSKRLNRVVDTADGVDTDQGLAGLARTVRKDNGGASFTLICHQDLFYTNKPKPIPQAQPAPGAGGSGTPPASGSFDTGSGSSGGNDQPELTVSLPGVYLGLDIDEDPFARGEGAVVGGDFELRIGMSASASEQSLAFGLVAEGPARLRIDALFKSDVDTDAASGELTLYPQALTYKNGEPDEDDEPDQPASLEVVVYRKGDARSGKVWIVPALASLRRLGISAEAHWGGQPRLAEVGLRRIAGDNHALSYRHKDGNYLLDNGQYLAEEDEGQFASFLTLREMEQLPAPESPIRLEALNAIATLSEYTANPAFLSRARNRLFPAVTTSGPLRVRAVHDWVMFRRRRQAVCDASCACTAPAAQAEGFQTWHLRLEDVGELETLRQAIDDNDAETLKRFSFKRVDVLHYLDDALTPIELQKTVLADWKKAKPAARLVLGRVWEQAPRTGQGWQNHYRLRRLVGLLGGLIEPPTVDVVHALSRAPKPLEDAQFDGGMLLVTAEQAPPAEVETAHRVLLIHNENLFASLDDLKSGSGTVWNELENQVDQKSTFALTVHFVDGVLAAADETELKKLADEIRENFDVNFTDAMIVRGNAIPPEQHVQEEHDTIRAVAGAPAAGGDYSLPNALLKDAAVATILPFGQFKP